MVRLRLPMLWVLLAACGNDHGLELDADTGNRGLPCDVQAMISDRCDGCHGNQLAGGATVRLVNYDDLVRTNKDGITIAAEALARMKLASSPMPPSPAVASASDIVTLENWITAGMPRGDCMGGGGPFGPADLHERQILDGRQPRVAADAPGDGVHPVSHRHARGPAFQDRG
jgi:hypothetical protein